MKRPVFLIIFIFVTILGLGIAQISMANQISTTGSELASLQNEVDKYERENTILEEELLEASSFTNISKKAKELGFAESRTQVSLTAPLPLALKQ
jgi:cell division protein FtsL